MAQDQSVVTVRGPDRAALLTDLTLPFGRIDVVEEREVVLPGGGRGVEVTALHQPFTDGLPDIEQLEEEVLEAEAAHAVPEAPEAAAAPAADPPGREEADRLLVEAHAEAER